MTKTFADTWQKRHDILHIIVKSRLVLALCYSATRLERFSVFDSNSRNYIRIAFFPGPVFFIRELFIRIY